MQTNHTQHESSCSLMLAPPQISHGITTLLAPTGPHFHFGPRGDMVPGTWVPLKDMSVFPARLLETGQQ